MTSRMMHLNLFVFGCGHHRGAWRHPQSSVERLGDIRYYEQLAQIAERGKLDAVFFADGHAVGNVADGSAWFLEPFTELAAMSRATELSYRAARSAASAILSWPWEKKEPRPTSVPQPHQQVPVGMSRGLSVLAMSSWWLF